MAPDRAEAFAWLTTAMWGDYGVGMLVAGHMQTARVPSGVFMTAALAALLAAGVSSLLSSRTDETNPQTDG